MGEKLKLFVCTKGKHCKKQGAKKVYCAMLEQLEEMGLEDDVCLKKSECLGQCSKAPAVQVKPHNYYYGKIGPDDCEKIIKSLETPKKTKPVKKLLIKR
jgi:(2Fe-2S) ferredoxin